MKHGQIRLVHIITGLEAGGAETMLYKLLKDMNQTLFYNEVISLTGLGSIGRKLRGLGFKVTAMGMRRGAPSPMMLLKLFFLLRKSRPDLVQTWMYHSDLIGGIVARLCGIENLCWNIRHCNLDKGKNKFLTLLTAKACAILSGLIPSRIICNSHAGKRTHSDFGYVDQKIQVIPNCFDLGDFFPDAKIRNQVRKTLRIDRDTFVFGHVGRYDVQKNHEGLFRSFAFVVERYPDALLVCCGKGVSSENRKIIDQIQSLNLCENVLLLGLRKDVSEVLNAFDLLVSSSVGEGFSNAIGEAMAVELPCVVTDVGDSARVVGSTGWVVDPDCHESLAEAMTLAMDAPREELRKRGRRARRRMGEIFSVEAIISSFEQLYLKLILK